MVRPRKPGSGGARAGAPGKAYPNRSDMNAQPVRTTPNQTYGVAGQQQAAQQAIPLPQQPTPGAGMAAGPMPAPTPLGAPTTRPNEPLTAGIASGPGPGPEVLAPPNPLVKAAAALNALGDKVDADTAAFRAVVNATLNNQGAA